MSDELELLDQTLRSIFAKHFDRDARTATGQDFPRGLWTVLENSGLTSLGEVDNGVGLAELVVLARALGRAAAPVPLVEMSGIASWLVTSAGMELPTGITTSSAAHPDDDLLVTRTEDGWAVSGVLHRVPWGRDAAHVAAIVDTEDGAAVALLPVPESIRHSHNLGDEPRDTLTYDGIAVPASSIAPTTLDQDQLLRRGALLRSASMVGAMESALDLSLAYADQREQFGKPISSFQAVQHHLVAVAEETMCAAMGIQLAAAANPDQQEFAVAAAKNTAGVAAAVVTKRAHQVHAAIGVTQEHALPWFTKRLWAWQDEFGTTRQWSAVLGRELIAGGGAALWPTISATVGGSATMQEAVR